MSSPRQRKKRQYRGPARSCEHCYGWGILRQRLCRGCEGFAAKYDAGTCQTCRRDGIPVDSGVCRLCRKQAAIIAGPGNKTATDLTVAATTGHQLFLTDLTRSATRRSSRDNQDPEQAIAAAGPNQWAQPFLFEIPRDCRRASSRDAPRDPRLLDLVARKAATIAELNGWPPRTLQQVRRGLGMIASSYHPGEPIHASTVAAMSPHGVPGLRVLEVLAEAVPELLIDDRPDSLAVWIDDAFDGIPTPMRNEIDAWVDALRHGTPRREARPRATAITRLAAARPFIWARADQYDTLRQVTKEDVLSWLETSPRPAHDASALCDLFRVLKAKRLVFANPMRGIRASRSEQRTPAPIAAESLRIIGAAAAQDPALKAVVALIGVQALHPAQTRALTLDDLDLQNQRLAIQGEQRAIDSFTLGAIAEYLEYRNDRWPSTGNPHLLLSRRTAHERGPVSPTWLEQRFRGLGCTPRQLREDRIVEESDASSGDPLQLAAMFGLSASAALRYSRANRPGAAELLKKPLHARRGSHSITGTGRG